MPRTKKIQPPCSVEWCTRPQACKGLCRTCYNRRWARAKQQSDPETLRAANRRWAAGRQIVEVTITEKRCSRCELTKKATEFHRQKRGSDGLQAVCKNCAALGVQEYSLKRRCANVGITVEQYWKLMARQCGLCGVCGKKPATDLDHCHATGRFRGIVCAACNRILGTVQDDTEHLLALVRYLTGE